MMSIHFQQEKYTGSTHNAMHFSSSCNNKLHALVSCIVAESESITSTRVQNPEDCESLATSATVLSLEYGNQHNGPIQTIHYSSDEDCRSGTSEELKLNNIRYIIPRRNSFNCNKISI